MSDKPYKLKVLSYFPTNPDTIVLGVIKKKRRVNYLIVVRSNSGHTELKLGKDEFFEPFLTKHMSRIFISGESGCGKSTLISTFVKNSPFETFLLSAKEYDPAFDKLKRFYKFDANKLIEQPIKDLKTFKNKTLIFDDIRYVNPKINKYFRDFRDRILSLGRQDNINCISTEWIMKGREATKYPLLQSQCLAFFPEHDKNHAIQYLADRGYNKQKIINKIKQFVGCGRWMILMKMPPILMTSKKIEILNLDDL